LIPRTSLEDRPSGSVAQVLRLRLGNEAFAFDAATAVPIARWHESCIRAERTSTEASAMTYPAIVKASSREPGAPVLLDYESARRAFSWDTAREQLSGLPDGRGLNIAHEAVDRHAAGPERDRTAIRWLGKHGARKEISYGELAASSSRFANALASLGIGAGDLVCSLLGRVPELFAVALGTLKHRALFSPLFSAFGPDPIKTRLQLGGAKVLVTTPRLYARKVATIRAELPALRAVIVVDEDGESPPDGTLSYTSLVSAASATYVIEPTRPEDPALLHFTSGTTGTPKGALHVHDAVVMHHVTAQYALDLRAGDVFWCTADPGWVTGTSYGIIAPLTNRVTLIVDEAEFDVQRWYEILERERVNVFYTAPTAIRRLMRAGAEPVRGRDLSALRFLASVGEPLNPEAVIFGQQVFGRPFHDNWWQTETGGIMIANFAAMDVKPGSMGKPLPGVEASVVRRTPEGGVEPVAAGAVGELALKRGWPSMFRAYFKEPERYARCFAGELYLTGDLVQRDDDGYFWFVGRADDVIKTAGHLVGPFEVESALMEHPAVAEAGVIGKPDPVAGDVVKAFVLPRVGHEPSAALQGELLGFARKRLGAAIAPREIAFVTSLPRTRSGKILRRLLRARELGLPEGDLSTLEADG
jgi:acetyl-CoA synthetase